MKGGKGWRRQKLDWRDKHYNPPIASSAAATAGNYDLSPLFPPCYDQFETNSCTGNATCGAYHYLAISQGIHDLTPSRLFTYYNARLDENDVENDNGAEIRDAVKSLAKDGTIDESLWPFTPGNLKLQPPVRLYREAKNHLALSYSAIPDNLCEADKRAHILSCLKHKIPVVCGISCFSAFDSGEVADTGLVPMPNENEKSSDGHAIVLVGWNAEKELYKFRNSWGTWWGKRGYGFLPAAYIENQNLASDFWSIFNVEKDAPK